LFVSAQLGSELLAPTEAHTTSSTWYWRSSAPKDRVIRGRPEVSNLGLKESKNLVEADLLILEGVAKEAADGAGQAPRRRATVDVA